MSAFASGLRALSAAAACVAVVATVAPAGALTDYQKNQVLQHLDSPRMRLDQAIFDGQRFVQGVEFQKVSAYYAAFVDELNKAIAAWNKYSDADRASPDIQPIQAKLVAAINWGKAMNAVYPQLEAEHEAKAAAAQNQAKQQAALDKAGQAAHHAKCQAFAKGAVNNTPLRDPMHRMVDLLTNHYPYDLASVKSIDKHRAALTEVAGLCADPQFDEAFFARPCWFNERGPADDLRRNSPKHWCDAAAQRDSLLRQAAINHAAKLNERADSQGVGPDDLQRREGWLTSEQFITYLDVTTVTPEQKKARLAKLGPVLEAAGVTDIAALPIWAADEARKAAFKVRLDQLAPTWDLPANAGSDYSVALAKKIIKKAHPKAKGLTAWLSRATWHIDKNAAGIPTQRTKPGYALFQLPGEPWCQLWSYTLSEGYAGGGKYQKAQGVNLHSVRWQRCK